MSSPVTSSEAHRDTIPGNLPGIVTLTLGSSAIVFSEPQVLVRGDLIVLPNLAPDMVYALGERVGPDGRATLADPRTMAPVPYEGDGTVDYCSRADIAEEIEVTKRLTSATKVSEALGISRLAVHGIIDGTGLSSSRIVAELRCEKLRTLRLFTIGRAQSAAAAKTGAAKP